MCLKLEVLYASQTSQLTVGLSILQTIQFSRQKNTGSEGFLCPYQLISLLSLSARRQIVLIIFSDIMH